jgi:hypothetical protein
MRKLKSLEDVIKRQSSTDRTREKKRARNRLRQGNMLPSNKKLQADRVQTAAAQKLQINRRGPAIASSLFKCGIERS